MANIQIFTSPEFGDIRTVDQNGEPWFVGKDVAAALGYGEGKSLANAVSNHVDEQDRSVTEMMTEAGKRNFVVINESGLYSLIFGSKLEGAVRFKRWVTSEVLPALRKTGSYMMPKLSKEILTMFFLDNRTQRQEERLTALENTMTVDYNQQRVLRKAISRAVIGALGGEDTPAYIDNHVRSKVYSECNHDVQDWFRVNSVGNIPRKRFDEAVEYIRRRECVMSSESLRGSEPPPWALVVSYPDIVPDWNEMKNEMREQLVDLSHPVWSDAQMNASFSCGNLRQMELQRRNRIDLMRQGGDGDGV